MKRIMLFASALALAACTNSGGSSGAAPTGGIPGKLGNHPVVSKTALTGTEKATIRHFSSKMEKMPDSGLFLPSQNESAEERAERDQKRNKLSPDGKLNYDKIQNNCQFQFPQPTGSQESQTVTASIGGNRCPIRFNQIVKNEMISQPGGKSSSFKSSTTGDMQVLDPSLQNQIGFSRSTTNFSMSGSFTGSETSSSSFMSGSGGISLQTLNGQNASMNMSYEMLMNDASMKSYTEMTLTLDTISATIQVYMESNQGQTSAKIYLNGQPTTEDELKDIFGENFEVGTNQN